MDEQINQTKPKY